MAEADVSAGVDLTLGDENTGKLFDLLGKIHVGINNSVAEQRKAFQAEQARLANNPNYVVKEMATITSNAFDLIDFGTPQPGRQWEIRILSAYSRLAPAGANATAVTWYVGTGAVLSAAQTLGVLDLPSPWLFPSLPNSQKFGGEIVVLPNQHLVAGLTGIPASSNIKLVVAFQDEPYNNAQVVVAS